MNVDAAAAPADDQPPDLLLVVLGVGDMSFREKSSKAIQEIIRSNRTVVLVSHNMGVLEDICDRIVWIEADADRDAVTALAARTRHLGRHVLEPWCQF